MGTLEIALIAIGIPFLVAVYAQWKVKSAFGKWQEVSNLSGLSGAEAARRMLDHAGLRDVRIERVQGSLTDHYDPHEKKLALSEDVHDQKTVSAIGVACHEAGHAIQDAKEYAPLTIRNLIVPTAQFGSSAGLYLMLIGAFFALSQLVIVGAVLFSAVVVFQLINLPVEFDATARAKKQISALGIAQTTEEEQGVNEVLNSAALTYVAATLVAIGQMLYLLMLFLGE